LAELEAERTALRQELETALAIRNRCKDAEGALNQAVEEIIAERKRVKELSARRVRNSLVQPEGGCPQVVHLVVGFLATAKPASFSRPAGLSRMQLAW